jgi:predicted phosphodiesterase
MSPLAAVIADTHVPRRAGELPDALTPHLERADLILHAGDLMDPRLIDGLSVYAPTRVVGGTHRRRGYRVRSSSSSAVRG